ncbi:NAD(P)/FAD-dependent oxidoreductase [Aliiruegeria sabulilitoris]|uniref:NAD(P)/FAD-dependent oxidoreductase n=1 Tax=Aliiruegeria sabulilitoris TaxID=1510458 RepID=UPI00082D99D3|nr:FAD-binding oxidoreductase [Aliiruegeria sabulilitoris]NDR54876.1 FAD-binding oxidoreductase [Pseudoruegeria sp. M32A2M]
MAEKVDVAIVGGGIMGASTAYWLSLFEPRLRICVFERDPTHEFSSTALSVASIRQQFTAAINVRISGFGLEFIRNFSSLTAELGGVDLGFRGNGYLFLAGSETGAENLREAVDMQRGEGAGTEALTAEQLCRLFPWISAEGVSLASFGGSAEGWFDNMGLLAGLRDLARLQGVRFEHAEVVGVDRAGRVIGSLSLSDGRRVSVGEVVNAAGPRASLFMRKLSEEFPVEPRKRTVFVVDAPNARHPDAPLLIDYQGYYARPEGTCWITATVPENDTAVDCEDFDARHWDFEENIWPKLYRRIPGFDQAKVIRHWVGHYAFNTLDQNAILGRHPNWDNLLLINGFSGHGLQQAPAMGRGLAELLVHGHFRSLDLSEFSMERILENRPFRERGIV